MLTAFTRQLSTLQDAGLPILRSLQILEQQQKPGLMKAVIGGVVQRYEMAKFARTLGTLLDNGVPVFDFVGYNARTP